MNLLDVGFRIRHADEDDLARCQQIAREFPTELPFIANVQFRGSLEKRELFVAEAEGQVVGFVRWHARRDGWQTLYDLAVARDWQGRGIGRALLYAVPAPLRLKVTEANVRANEFYQCAGLCFVEQVAGRRQALNVYSLSLLSLFVMGGNAMIPPVASASGMAYGVRNDYAPAEWPFMLDIHWEDYDWQQYLLLMDSIHPVQAMVADYERPDQRNLMLSQVQDLRVRGVLRIMVCPKFDGAVAHVPEDCVVAVSVPSRYAGFLASDLNEYRGRKLHLLGGKPHQWLDLIPKLHGVGARVISVDGSSHEVAAKKGTHFEGGKWRNFGKKADYKATMVYSGRCIVREVQAACDVKQFGFGG